MKVLGLLDTLESVILEGFKIPLSKKTVVEEEKLLSIIDKIRLVIQSGDDFPSPQKQNASENSQMIPETVVSVDKSNAADVLEQAYKLAKEVREGADKYADEVLSNMELTTTRVLRTVRAGRERLDKTVRAREESVEA